MQRKDTVLGMSTMKRAQTGPGSGAGWGGGQTGINKLDLKLCFSYFVWQWQTPLQSAEPFVTHKAMTAHHPHTLSFTETKPTHPSSHGAVNWKAAGKLDLSLCYASVTCTKASES
ncbi:uncharacterized [Tachysurus ichikawai]